MEQTVDMKRIRFLGSGSELFGIYLVNILLTIVTFGIYGAWAKARRLRYLYGNVDLYGSVFEFHGTGREIFVGVLKTILVMAVLYVLYILGAVTGSVPLILAGTAVLLLGSALVMPMAVHGALRYRLSRTSWRGIHLGYRGSRGTLSRLFLKGMFFSVITFGIYGSWFDVRLKKYIAAHVRFGDVSFEFDGDGKEYFFLNLKGVLLSVVTFGIYSFWYAKNRFNYFYDHIHAMQDGVRIDVRGTLTAGTYFKTGIINLLLLAFTAGIAYPWVIARTLRMYTSNIELLGAFNPDTLVQTEEDYADAAGEGFFDLLDIGDGLW